MGIGEQLVRHPHIGWVPDRNGNPSEKPLFGDDIPAQAAVAPAGTSEPVSGTDSPAEELADVFLPPGTANGPHDEWTVRGRRWRQVGPGEEWIGLSGHRFGIRIRLARRVG